MRPVTSRMIRIKSTSTAEALLGIMASSLAALVVHRELVRAEAARGDASRVSPPGRLRRHGEQWPHHRQPPEHAEQHAPAQGPDHPIRHFHPNPHLRDLGKRRFPTDELPEKIVAKAIVEHLELCGWRLEHKAKPTVTAAR